jgi:hypothetical protein
MLRDLYLNLFKYVEISWLSYQGTISGPEMASVA